MECKGDIANQPMSAFASTILSNKYAHTKPSGRKEVWAEVAARVAGSVMNPYVSAALVDKVRSFIEARKLIPGGRYLYAAGRPYPQCNNCMLFRAEDSRDGPGGWADIMRCVTSSLMTGGGVGVVYSRLRAEGSLVAKMGGNSTGPLALMRMVNEAGRYIMQGGSRRSAIWAGLHWNHPDVFSFINCKRLDTPTGQLIRQCRSQDFNFPAPMDGTNISVILDDDFFTAYGDPSWARTYSIAGNRYLVNHAWAREVYWTVVEGMCRDGEPGFSIDTGGNGNQNLRNACTEVTSEDDKDMCNLASVNLARIRSREELAEVVQAGISFLLCGTLYSPLPIPEMYPVREKNRRLGLGLMGVHEWLLKRGYRYEMNDELGSWMKTYEEVSTGTAAGLSSSLGVSCPVATRSIAPTGTISIIAETTSGIEPIFAAAFKRRYLDGRTWKAQYVVDATAKRLIDGGVDPAVIEDAYTLSEDITRRVRFQRDMQRYVDHGISSTINLPQWGSSVNNPSTLARFGASLLPLLPDLRGITAYPDGARGGQPLNRVPYTKAIRQLGLEFSEDSEATPRIDLSGSSPPSSPSPPASLPAEPTTDPAQVTPPQGTPSPLLNGHLPSAPIASEVDSGHAAAQDAGGDTCRNGFCSS